MKFREYLKKRGVNSLTLIEHDILGIPKVKGYVKKFADQEITEEQLQLLSEHVQKNPRLAGSTIGKVLTMTKTYQIENDKQYLYFMVNEVGRTKIGISYDPINRARQLTTSSGMLVKCLCAWEIVNDTAKSVEQKILKRYKKYKSFGEWFVEGAVDLERVIDYIKSSTVEFTEIHRDLEAKENYEFYDVLDYLSIKHQTDKAYLFSCDGYDVWIPKAFVFRIEKENLKVKISKGRLNGFTKINQNNF